MQGLCSLGPSSATGGSGALGDTVRADTLIQYNTIRGQFCAQSTTKTEQLGITVLMNDKSQLK